MKKLKCDLCDETAEGETFEDWMKALRPHYMEAHADAMNNSSHTTEDMEKWMSDNKARFDAYPTSSWSAPGQSRRVQPM